MKRKERFDWEKFWDSFPFWGFIIGLLVLGMVIEGIIGATKPEPIKEPAVVIEVIDARLDDYKVKYLFDGVVQVVDLNDDNYIVGDTVLVKR